ncbi:MAG: hypothetical protein ABI688_00015 [Bacteroidota bacterium]
MQEKKRQFNKEWHLANPMPKNANLAQRISWHLGHSANCGCREIPEPIKKEIAKRKLAV